MDVFWYAEKFNIGNFDKSNIEILRGSMENDFVNEALGPDRRRDPHNITFEHFRQCIINLLIKIQMLDNRSNGTFEPNDVWKPIFNQRIRHWCRNYFSSQYNQKFLRLETHFDRKDYIHTEEPKEEPLPQEWNVSKEVGRSLRFMGLEVGFTAASLTKRYRELSKKYHPDKGGDADMFRDLMTSTQTLRSYLQGEVS